MPNMAVAAMAGASAGSDAAKGNGSPTPEGAAVLAAFGKEAKAVADQIKR